MKRTFLSELVTERNRHTLPKVFGGEGWTDEGDDQHKGEEMARAAACYLLPAAFRQAKTFIKNLWPWAAAWWKPAPDIMPFGNAWIIHRQREIIKGCSLAYAEWERLERRRIAQNIEGLSEQPTAAADTLRGSLANDRKDLGDTLAAAVIIEPEDIQPIKPGEPGAGIHNPDNPEPETPEQFNERIKNHLEQVGKFNDPNPKAEVKDLSKARFKAMHVLLGIYDKVKNIGKEWAYYQDIVAPLADYVGDADNENAIREAAEDKVNQELAKSPLTISWDYSQTPPITVRAWYDSGGRLHIRFDEPIPKPDDPERFT